MATTEEMDAMYRKTRHVYDFTRKYYLLGRDRLLEELDLRPGDNVVEIGCGTARNLIRLAKGVPDIRLYGLDASNEMLVTAQAQIKKRKVESRITLRQGLAEELNHEKTFGLDRTFDIAFFSYSLSMIPTWEQAIDAAVANVRRGGAIYVVDFWDQGRWPRWFRWMLKRWLDRYHVHFRPELLEYLENLDAQHIGKLTIKPIAGRYAYLATFRKL